MKNIILGAAGFLIALYTIASCLSIYSISARKNEMENCMARVLQQNLESYYASGCPDSEVASYVRQDLIGQLHAASKLTVEIRACDMTTGVICVRVTESFGLPGGGNKTIACEKTVIVETEEVYETEVETEQT